MNHKLKKWQRRFCLSGLFLALVFVPLGCKHKKVSSQTQEEPGQLASTIQMGDPKMSPQLMAGLHEVENNAWRWTERQFTIALRPPAGASRQGATLSLKLTVPPVVIANGKSVTLSASIDDTPLAPETYSKAGEYAYKRDVPAGALAGDRVRVQFTLDKAIPPSESDRRELGVIVTSAALERK
jgi:hypothetical protein